MTTVYADAYGFNANDATAALQAAINSGADKIIVSNKATPWLISSTINLKSNQEIEFAPDVVVQAKLGSFLPNTNPLFKALGINNVKLVGQGVGVHQATFAMNKSVSTNDDSDHIIAIQGTDNYTISGLTLTGSNSDGIIIDSYSTGQPIPVPNTLNYSDHGLIDNVTVTNSSRNGLAVISAQNLTVTNSKFNNSSNLAPASGITFEPDFSYDRLSNINISNVDLSGNQGNGVDFNLSNLDNNSTPISITINGATVNNNQSSGIKLETYSLLANDASATQNGVINISNVTIDGTTEINTFDDVPNSAISIQALSGDPADSNNLKINFSNVAISNTGFNTVNPQLSANPIVVRGFGGSTNRNQIGNVAFNNVTVADNYNRSIVTIEVNQAGSLNNITGNIRGINPNGVTADITSSTPTAIVTKNNFTLTVTSATLRNDFNGDGKSDILWRNTDGRVALWQMNGSTLTTGSVFANVSTAWTISNTGDFNGDSKADILWRNTDGQVALWQMNGATPTIQTVIGSAPTNWQISGTGDFNGDSKADILWRNTTDGSVAIWQMNGNTPTAQTIIGSAATDWKITGTGDFNGDGKSDMLWRKANGDVAMWQMNGTTPISQTVFANVSTDWQIAGTGDFNGDGKADILWRNNDGQVAIWSMNGATALSKDLATPYPSVDNSWKISGTSDFNGDGKADILWRNDNGSVETWLMNGSTVTAANLVTPNPVVDNTWKIAAPIL
jgi:FG-GAP-like repeat